MVYGLGDWRADRVGVLVSALRDRGIPFSLEGNELSVPVEREREVDEVVREIDGAAPTLSTVPLNGAPSPTNPPAPGSSRDGRVWLGVAAGGVVLGSVMPWITVSTAFGSADVAGTEGDGVLTLICGIAAGILVFFGKRWLAAAAFAVASVVGLYDVINVSDEVRDLGSDFARARVGWGLWLVVAASVAGLVFGIATRRRAVPLPPPSPIAAPRS